MKKLFFLLVFLFFNQTFYAQVAINTTGADANPNAVLDISGTLKGILIPRLSSADLTTMQNSLSAIDDGLTVYDTDTKSFWVWGWNNSSSSGDWKEIGRGDADFYEEGTYNPPDNNYEDIYTMGNVAIGKNMAYYPLDISYTGSTGVNVAVSNSNSSTFDVPFYSDISGTSEGNKFNSYQHNTNSGGGPHCGTYREISGSGSGIHYGSQTRLSGTGSGNQYGAYYYIENSGSGDHFGTYSHLTGTGNGTKYGNYIHINPSAGGTQYGIYSEVQKSGSYSGYFKGDLTVALGRVEFQQENDATGNPGTGVLEIADNLRIDRNEIITNTGSSLLLQNDNDGYLKVDGHDETFTVQCSSNRVGIGTEEPYELLEVANRTHGNARMIVSDGNGTDRYVLLFVSPSSSYEHARIESYKYGSGETGKTLDVNTIGHGLVVMGGDLIPQYNKGRDLGSSSYAWDDVYYDDLHNMGAAAFTDREVTKELLKFKPQPKPAGAFDEKTEKGLKELDPNSVPPDLRGGYDLLTDEMTTYNYKANYEQQLQIEKLKTEIKQEKKKNELEQQEVKRLQQEVETLKEQLLELTKLVKNKN